MKSESTDIDAIIIVTLSRWDQDVSSASISMAKELSKTVPVFFMDNPFTVKDVVKGWRTPAIRRRRRALLFGRSMYREVEPGNSRWIAVTPRMVLPINWLPEGALYNALSRLNNWLFMRSVRAIIRDFGLSNFVFFNSFNPFYGYRLPADIAPKTTIYQSRDNIRESAYIRRHGPRLERLAARMADIRLATSSDLVEQLSKAGAPFRRFPNAAAFEHFAVANKPAAELPEAIRQLPRPIIGYMGNVCLRIDYDLLVRIAERFPHCTVLMVGPRNDADHHAHDLSRFKNLVFVGPQPFSTLPTYLSVMDCALLPFKINQLTRSIYPLKINEYLAAGKPVVSTSFSSEIKGFAPHIYLADDPDAFLDQIEAALGEPADSPARAARIQVAKQNSWTVRAEQFLALLA
jgi:teichuronic acid biosynthesis glycosyltransferase TuaH